jgi:hypothetical protein
MIDIPEIAARIVALPYRPPVIIDRDLAALYEQPTGEINRTAALHQDIFPADVFFLLTKHEAERPEIGWTRGHPPHAFTREGAYLLAATLKTPVAIARSTQIVQAFRSHESTGAALADLLTLIAERLAAIEAACGVSSGRRQGNRVSFRSRPNGLRFPEVQAVLDRMRRDGYTYAAMADALKAAWPDDPTRHVPPATIGRFCKGLADGRTVAPPSDQK